MKNVHTIFKFVTFCMIIFNKHNIEPIRFCFLISDKYLMNIMCDALADVHRGVIHLLSDINSK